MRQEFIDLLISTERQGMDGLIEEMYCGGFFEAPCSGNFHLAKEGGLLEHSLNVYDAMNTLSISWCIRERNELRNSIIICALLHDLGKMGDYGKPNYVPNLLKSGKVSDSKPYETNKNLLYVPHEVRSVSIASKHIRLTEEEYFAILYHNGLYGDFKYAISGKETPLYMLLHFADLWSSRVTEAKQEIE